jgi:hypothetical protein
MDVCAWQEWKIANNRWSPDTPAASLFADDAVKKDYYLNGIRPGKYGASMWCVVRVVMRLKTVMVVEPFPFSSFSHP